MALMLPNSIFFHIPKTGGTFITGALMRSHMGYKKLGNPNPHPLNLKSEHTPPDNIDKMHKKGKFLYCFVREPKTWYQSMWAYRKNGDWDKPSFVIDTKCRSEDFNRFVEKVLANYPQGFMTQMVKEFTGENGEKMDFIGRMENLRPDLLKALEMAGEEIDPHFIQTMPEVNVTTRGEKFEEDIRYKKGMLQKIKEAERWVYETFY